MKKALIIGGIAIFGYSIYYYFIKQANLLKQFTYEVIGFNLDKITANSINGIITFRFTSISDIDITVSNLNLILYLNGYNVGTVNSVTNFLLPARGYNDIPINFDINPKLILGNISDIFGYIFKSKDGIVTIDGTADVSSGFIKAKIPIKFNCSIKNMDCVQI